MKSNLKPHQTAIVAAGLASLAITFVPFIHWIMLPMIYLNTHLHELCHALAALMTGGGVDRIEVYANGSGATLTEGGNRFLISSAGYVGAAITGAAVMWHGRTERAAKSVLVGLGIALLFAMVLWVRGDVVGVISGIVWIGVLYAIVRYAEGPKLLFAVQLIGLQQCLQAAQSLNELLKISAYSQGDSDARNMEMATGIPAIAWAVGWCLFSLAMVTLGLRKAWSTSPERPASRRGA